MPITLSQMKIQGASLEGDNPLPPFRNRNHHREVPVHSSYPDELRTKLGYEAGERYLPYRMQDRYSRSRTEMSIDTIILENDRLKAVFLPQYGGRLYSLTDKKANRNLLYTNPVFQPGNLAILNAWFSGGVEWNIGQLGHTFTTCSPLHAAQLTDKDGNEFLRFYEYERCKNVFWHIDFHLPPGSDKLIAHVRIVNDNSHSVPMYWWTNIAVDETPQARMFSTSQDVIYIDHEVKGFGFGQLPILPTVPGEDVTYPYHFPFSNEYFFQTPASCRSPWEAVAYEDGRLFYERSTSLLRYRKMFCWGHHPGGRRWCDFLSNPGEGNYIEIQGGFAPTQLHGMDMPAHAEWDFTQVFGMTDVDTDRAYQPDWPQANAYIQTRVDELINEAEIDALHAWLQGEAQKAPLRKIYEGSPWGWLEQQRRAETELDSRGIARDIPYGFDFSVPTGENMDLVEDWSTLLHEGGLPERDVNEIPRSWMVQEEWYSLLESSLRCGNSDCWNAYMHLGIMLYERGMEDEAVEAWHASVQLKPSAWVFRNLAVAMKHKGKTAEAADYMEQAYNVSQSFPDKAFAEEYLNLLIESRRYEDAWRFYHTLPDEYAKSDRIQIIVGAAALELGEDEFINRLFLQEFAVIREGELLIIELWYNYQARKLAAERSEPLGAQHLADAKLNFPPPNNIDFRIIGD